MKNLLWKFGCLTIIALTFSSILTAQSATATLSGTVTDQQGAVVAGATVKITDAARAYERQTTTNDEESFTFVQLQPTTYTVKAERSGFSAAEFKDVVLNVCDRRSLQIVLRAGEVSGTVVVDGKASSVDESPAAATTIDREFLENLPLNGRSFQSLIGLTPGVVPTATSGYRLGQFSVNRQRESSNYFSVDGVGANLGVAPSFTLVGAAGSYGGFNAQGATSSLVSIDALQEFKIQTSTFAPEFGRTPGAQVQIVTRSGTNRFSGTLFEYFRNEALDANDWFANARGLPRPPLRNNQFGGVVSGPVFLPRFGEGGDATYDGRNRTFFFFSYEGLRLRLPQVAVNRRVPSLRARAATTGAVRAIFNAFPLPTGAEILDNAGLPTGLSPFAASYSDPSSSDAAAIRINHNFSDQLAVFFGRYNRSPSETVRRSRRGYIPNVERYSLETITLGSTFAANAGLVNDLRVNYSSNRSRAFKSPDNFGGATPPNDADFLPSFASSAGTEFYFSAGNASIDLGSTGRNAQRQINIVDTLSIVRGSHQLKFGVDYRRLLPTYSYASYAQYIYFDNVAQAITGNLPLAYIGATDSPLYPRYTNFSVFAQDTWRVSPRTETYGPLAAMTEGLKKMGRILTEI